MPGLSGRLMPLPVSWVLTPAAGVTQLSADKTVKVFKAPFACQVIDAGHVHHEIALTKSATNYYDIHLHNGGAAGTGTSIIATKSFKSTTVAAGDVTALVLSGTVAWHKLDAGDYVNALYDETGALTGGVIFRGCFFFQYGYSQ